MEKVMLKVFPGLKWRYGGRSIPDHYHIHEAD